MVVVDEAHHLASRRQGYKQLPGVLKEVRPEQVLAVTATASDEVASHIVKALELETMIVDPHVRDNLQLVDQRSNYKKADYLIDLASTGEKVVVYLNSRHKAVQLAELLREKVPQPLQNKICYYHGGLSSGDRLAIENAFRDGTLKVIVTTSAFGEGIDIPDIRHVVLYHLSFSSEEYNQLAGRAGRDGAPAKVHLLYNQRDEMLNRNVLSSSCPSREVLGKFYKLLQLLIQGKPAIELTNNELCELVKRERFAEPTESCISSWLGIFEELGFLEREREGAKRRIIMTPSPTKMDLLSSLRYQECMAELEDFQRGVEGYNDNASQSQANANAKIVHVAVSSYISANPNESILGDGANFYLTTSDNEGETYFTFNGVDTCNLSDYLGSKFEGYSYVQFDRDKYVTVAVWAKDWEAMNAVLPYINGPLTTSELEDYQDLGYTIGCYPIAPDDNYFDY